MATGKRGKQDAGSGPDLLWGQPERARPGPRPALSREEIARVGIAIADHEGLGALSMRRIAEELGCTPMALYRHVPGKTELLAVMIDAAIGEAPSIDHTAAWRPQLVSWANETMALLRRHPWLLQIDTPEALTGPNRIAWIESGLRTIAEIGLTGDEMLESVWAVYRYACGTALLGRLWEQEETPSWAPSSPLMQRVAGDDRFPIFRALLAAGALDGPEGAATAEAALSESFEFGLQRILDGLEALFRDRRADAGADDDRSAPAAYVPTTAATTRKALSR